MLRSLDREEIAHVSGGQVAVGPGRLSVSPEGSIFPPSLSGGTITYTVKTPVNTSPTPQNSTPDYAAMAAALKAQNDRDSGQPAPSDPSPPSDSIPNDPPTDSGDPDSPDGSGDGGSAFGYYNDGSGGEFYGERFADD